MEQDFLRKTGRYQSVENLDNFVITEKQGIIHSISRNSAQFTENWSLVTDCKKRQEKPSVILSF
jgi:hypothetical protein